DDVVLPPAVGLARAHQRERACLGGPARERDRGRLGADERRHALARLLDGLVGRPPEGVVARRVAEVLAEERRHGLDDGGVAGGRGVVIEVDRSAHRSRGRTMRRGEGGGTPATENGCLKKRRGRRPHPAATANRVQYISTMSASHVRWPIPTPMATRPRAFS